MLKGFKALEEPKLIVTLPIQFFADDDTPPPGADDETPPPGDDKTPEEKAFTQTQVNAIAAKEAKQAQAKLMKQLGVTDVKDAKDALSKLAEWQESQKTDAEKQATALTAAQTALQAATAEKEALNDKLAALSNGVKADAMEDVIVLARLRVTDELDINEAIKQVVEKYPQYKTDADEGGKPGFTPGQHTPPGGGGMTREEFSKKSYADRVAIQQKQPEVFKKLFGK